MFSMCFCSTHTASASHFSQKWKVEAGYWLLHLTFVSPRMQQSEQSALMVHVHNILFIIVILTAKLAVNHVFYCILLTTFTVYYGSKVQTAVLCECPLQMLEKEIPIAM